MAYLMENTRHVKNGYKFMTYCCYLLLFFNIFENRSKTDEIFAFYVFTIVALTKKSEEVGSMASRAAASGLFKD